MANESEPSAENPRQPAAANVSSTLSAGATASERGVPESGADRFREAVQQRRAGVDSYEPEQTLWEGGYSSKAMVGTWALVSLLTIGAIVLCVMVPQVPWTVGVIAVAVLWLLAGTVYAYRRLAIYYQLTTQRFIHQTGILKRVTDRIEVIDIDDVSFEQGPVQRIFGVGTIRISSSDRSHPELTMLGIDQVSQVAGLIDDIRRKERRRRSLHIEAV